MISIYELRSPTSESIISTKLDNSLGLIFYFAGYEIFERMAYYGIATNLVLYLTNKLHEGTVESSNNVTNWAGTVWMTPLLGAYVADSYLGRYWTFVIASVIYLVVSLHFSPL